jgi:gamma-glutamyltranspeptidase
MDERDVRIAKTESLFRDVNERIAETSERFDAEAAQFMCECGDPSCAERLEVPLEEYEQVRADATTFVVDPDHVETDVEQVVEQRRGYAVVKKVDAAVARIVRMLDPRAEPA